ncbi:cytochrome b [Aphis craccivora]|uniref:Cytochrome b (Mitochondrion) n=1 Tax=Aphis craccivora TaxID=307492 RepID=A0A6G0VM70_APHCR|nr:cytochrome b [Aphis craccivora]
MKCWIFTNNLFNKLNFNSFCRICFTLRTNIILRSNILTLIFPYLLNDHNNFIIANSIITPNHIQPE